MSKPHEFAPALDLALRPIGVMRSSLVVHHEAPRQPRVEPASEEPMVRGEIHIAQGLQNALHDLEGFSHIWVLFVCDRTRGWNSKVQPPRDTEKRGVLATRSPARPNPIGLSCVRLVRVEKRVLMVGDHDILDGTPILDIKPYLPYCDSVPDARIGWVANVATDAADHREWWNDKDAPLPSVYRERLDQKKRDE